MIENFSENVEINMNNLRKWRDRYSPKEYPYKVVTNMFYDLIPLKMIWSEILNCFKQGKKVNSIDEGAKHIFLIFRNAQLTISGSMDEYMKNGIQIGDSNSVKLRTIIEKAKLGDNKCVEEIEYSYIARTSLKAFFIIWASMGLNGNTMEEAYQKISEVTISIKDFEDFEIVFQAFSNSVNIMIGGLSMGNENQIVKPLYTALPKLWSNNQQNNQEVTYFKEETIYRSVGFSNNTRHNYPLVCIEIVFFKDISEIYLYDIGFNPPYYDFFGLGNDEWDMEERRGKGFEGVKKTLKRFNKYVTEWEKVELPLYKEIPHMMANK
ncbi:hypothetical protein D4R71_02655 [bacterium]|nr:MAG: hypothetical protein D4R71_02655 [bacterium]